MTLRIEEIKGFSGDLIQFLSKYKAEEIFRTCLTCTYFKDEICQKAKARPPAFIIVRGCEKYLDLDSIPF